MDVAPTGAANGKTTLLLHGRNFSASYWKAAIRALSAAGYRVAVPDQINFSKSPKLDVPVNFDAMAHHTAALSDAVGIKQAAVIAQRAACFE